MRRPTTLLLLTALCLTAESRTIQEQMKSVPLFSEVKVGLVEGGELRGRLVKFDDDQLVLRVQEEIAFTDRTVLMSQVTSCKENKPGWLRRTAANVGRTVAAPFVLVAFFFVALFYA